MIAIRKAQCSPKRDGQDKPGHDKELIDRILYETPKARVFRACPPLRGRRKTRERQTSRFPEGEAEFAARRSPQGPAQNRPRYPNNNTNNTMTKTNPSPPDG